MKKDKKNKLFFLFLLLFIFVLGANFVLAQRELEIDYPVIPGAEVTLQTVEGTSLPEYVKYIFSFAIGIIGLLALGALIYGGIQYLTSAGSPEKLKRAKDQILAGILGLIILLSSYLILTTINPQLVVFEVSGLKKVEVEPSFSPITEIEKITSSISVELPLGTMVEERMLEEERMERIKNIAKDTENTAIEILPLGKYLACLTVKEFCDDRDVKNLLPSGLNPGCSCLGCISPVCIGSCCCKIVCNEEACWCVNCGCGACGCTSDPCCKVREEISQTEEKLQAKIKDLLVSEKKSNRETRELKIEVDKLKKALQLMQECPLWGLNSMDEFISLKDEYEKYDWELKKIKYWDYIDAKRNPATFYCPIGGTRAAYIPKSEISPEEFEEFSKGFMRYLEEEHEATVSCPEPIPFGEIMDKAITITNNLIKKFKELAELNRFMVAAIDNLTNLANQCTSANCGCSCGCGAGCSCIPSRCSGNPCPSGIPEAVEEVESIKEQIAVKKSEIDEIINEAVPEVLEELNKAKGLIRACISEKTVEPDWLLLDCERIIGNIGPDGKIMVTTTDACRCQDSTKCQKEFAALENYQCQEISDCYMYNFFCCRAKD